jgi:hypothetical protein
LKRKSPLSKKVMNPLGVTAEPPGAETLAANVAVWNPEMLLGETVTAVVVGALVPGLTHNTPSIPFAAGSQFESPGYEAEGKK